MKKLLVTIIGLTVLASAASATVTWNNVLLNGQLHNNRDYGTSGVDTNAAFYMPDYPIEFYTYGTAGGFGTYQGQSANNCIIYEVGDNFKYSDAAVAAGKVTQDGGNDGDWSSHSVIMGGSAAAAGQYGVKEVFSTTAGKLYFFTGVVGTSKPGASSSPFGDNIKFDFGIENGAVTANTGAGTDSFANAHEVNLLNWRTDGTNTTQAKASQTMQGSVKSNFTATMIATGNQMTIHAGVKDTDGTATGINAYIDGLRVWEMDIVTNSALVNGNFNNAVTDIGAKIWDNSGLQAFKAHDGWQPLGWGTGNIFSPITTSTGTDATQCMMVDIYRGQGRQGWFQKVAPGAGTYDIGGQFKTMDLVYGDARIGVDWTGGVDMNSSSVVWMDAATAANTWFSRTLRGQTGANGFTIFLATGNNNAVGFNAAGGASISGQAFFDNITVTPVPEPSSMLALASGLVGMVGFAVRRKRD